MLSFTFLYASFWRRAIAFAIDMIILGLISGLLLEPVVTWLGLRDASDVVRRLPFSVAITRAYSAWFIVTAIVAWLYFALQESSLAEATVGKRLLGLKVLTSNEGRLSFRKASLRALAKLFSVATIGAGFLLAIFDSRHRTLHDILAKTRVLEPKPEAFLARTPIQADP